MIPYRAEQTGNAGLDRIQSALRGLIEALSLVPFLRGRRVDGIYFAGGSAVTVRHGLGRTPRGYIVLRVHDGATPVEVPTEQSRDAATLVLYTDSEATYDCWIF